MKDPIAFVHEMSWDDLSEAARKQVELNILDLIGVGAGGMTTRLSGIVRTHAHVEFGGNIPMLFDGRTASASGMALAAGMTIDALDGHDGFNPAKGHIGAPLFPAVLAVGHEAKTSGRAFLEAIAMGYEFGARVSVAQHATVPDYHTSGSWGAVTAAAASARLLGLDRDLTRHAVGIAEYHGPRSQMMRCIDHPTMLKDGAGWGAMSGVSAVKLACSGFTGAPAITVEQATEHWDDLGDRWYVLEQYYKPYPVCRWAQAPMEAAMTLQATHSFEASDIEAIEIETFHESVRLAMPHPTNTEEAQYSTSFPVAVALVRGDLTPQDISDEATEDAEIQSLSSKVTMREHDVANAAFPVQRLARVCIQTRDGKKYQSDWQEPKWDHTAPPTEAELRAKFHALADPVLGPVAAKEIEDTLANLAVLPLSSLSDQLLRPIKASTTIGSAA
ncbi:2-methylcitrate dehydratase PrpD [Shimia isoporae]|uniref:2-methylcitrate dehydratase PrpD n=1 Tax=Shimia isoporae TaxID=647720 RepID=A0A4R1NXT0_9RHOB|nr:MmgE/PrpD family protein [Shimia isoporae]TCL10068.1 2-methylcitrate dehydratase PrpD [Shimia isoporae]